MRHALSGSLFLLVLLCMCFGWYMYSHASQIFSIGTSSPQQEVMGITTVHSQQKFQTTITKVLDGDTIVTQDGQKVRYIGINAPEMGQPYANEALDFNRSLVQGKKVSIVFDTQQKDRYGRLLGYVYGGNAFVNLEIVKKGWAIAENISPNTLHQNEFGQAEKTAKDTCQGLWSDLCMPVPQSCLKISTIQFDAAGLDDQNKNGEWIEITNNCTNTIDLTKYLVKDSSASNSYTFGAVSLGSHYSLKLHSGCGTNTFADIYWECPEKEHAVWNNAGDEAMLFDSHGKLLSVYKY